MTRLKELRKSAPKWMTTSLLDIIVEMDPSDTNKFVPIHQFFYFNAIEVLPEVDFTTKEKFENDV